MSDIINIDDSIGCEEVTVRWCNCARARYQHGLGFWGLAM